VEGREGKPITIRLACIDAPEIEYGHYALKALERLQKFYRFEPSQATPSPSWSSRNGSPGKALSTRWASAWERKSRQSQSVFIQAGRVVVCSCVFAVGLGVADGGLGAPTLGVGVTVLGAVGVVRAPWRKSQGITGFA
jgi:hypothetical protein